MGTIKQGILGGFSGSVGGIVGSSWKGIAVIKAKPLSVANPKTALQVGNRTSFKGAGAIGSELLTNIVKPLFDRNAQRMSGYNAFLRANKAAISDAGIVDVTKIILSLGKLAVEELSSFTAQAASKNVTVGWMDGSGVGEKLATDVAYVVAYNKTKNEWAQSAGAEVRSDEEVVVAFETAMEADDDVSAWLTFRSADGFKLFLPGSDLSNTVQ